MFSNVKDFTAEQFTPTKWEGADKKAKFAKQFIKFVQSDFAKSQFPHTFLRAIGSVLRNDRPFSTLPGDGCEPANFGFCQFTTPKLKGWRWHSFCKTQYASDPRCGGIENFLRCHLCVIKMLDFIKQTGLATVTVSDESDFWENRDMEKLAKEIGEWNDLVAGHVSELRTTVVREEKTIVAPITSFPNFEHLEAKGLERIADLRRKLGEK